MKQKPNRKKKYQQNDKIQIVKRLMKKKYITKSNENNCVLVGWLAGSLVA